MSRGIAKTILLLALAVVSSGCATRPAGYAPVETILSAAEAKTMITVDVKVAEPIAPDETTVAQGVPDAETGVKQDLARSSGSLQASRAGVRSGIELQ
jgi:hypothetical protein